MNTDYLENAPSEDPAETKPAPKRGPDYGAEAAEKRKRIEQKSDASRRGADPREAHRREYLGDGLPEAEAESKRSEWNAHAESVEMAEATENFLKANHITGKSALMDKISDPNFYLAHRDVLETRAAGDYPGMLRLAKFHAERELELDARRRYVESRQNKLGAVRGMPQGESFEAWKKRTGRA